MGRYKHNKRGTEYYVSDAFGIALAQCSTGPINEGDTVVVYIAKEGPGVYVRKYEEFHDGRFETVEDVG